MFFLEFLSSSSYSLIVLFKMLLLVLCFRQMGYAPVCLYALLLLGLGICCMFDGLYSWATCFALGCPRFCFGAAILDVWLLVYARAAAFCYLAALLLLCL